MKTCIRDRDISTQAESTRQVHWDRGRPGVPGGGAPLGWLTRPQCVAKVVLLENCSCSPTVCGRGRPRSHKQLNFALTLCVLFAFSACKREQRQFEPPPPNPPTAAITMSELRPGAQAPEPQIKNPAEESAYSVSEGKRLYSAYNCSGCHFNGGGGIGPALMDEKWIYGSEPSNIYATILEGRPNGMPSFRHKISDNQLWEITAYVRSLSGQLPKDISPTRSDDMNAHKSEQATEQKTPQNSGVPKSAEQP
jgi:cytochrome c oxidase cbb3-type subunit 3